MHCSLYSASFPLPLLTFWSRYYQRSHSIGFLSLTLSRPRLRGSSVVLLTQRRQKPSLTHAKRRGLDNGKALFKTVTHPGFSLSWTNRRFSSCNPLWNCVPYQIWSEVRLIPRFPGYARLVINRLTAHVVKRNEEGGSRERDGVVRRW